MNKEQFINKIQSDAMAIFVGNCYNVGHSDRINYKKNKNVVIATYQNRIKNINDEYSVVDIYVKEIKKNRITSYKVVDAILW